ncbi:flagellar hook-length control protein FliK [Marinomonas algicola]|uniref:flagellar hook-length control protein FliK n=1 Tax=Marinomonas algicola TaxID=2773454 RepID=UPI001748117C|nr:flagellar hook-length control protein FliK [Marinomonas algicola]
MMFDISKLNSSSSQAINSLKGQPTKELTGTLAKLSSELKLIESLELIKVNSAKDVTFQQKPAQIIEVSTKAHQNFNLINTQNKLDLQNGDTLQLHVQKNGDRAIISLINQNNRTPVPTSPNKHTHSSEQTVQKMLTTEASKNLIQNNHQNQSATTQNSSIQKHGLVNTTSNITKDATPTILTSSTVDLTQSKPNKVNTLSVSSLNNTANAQLTISDIKLPVNILSKTIPLTVLSISQTTTSSVHNTSMPLAEVKTRPNTTTTQSPNTTPPNPSVQSSQYTQDQTKMIQSQQTANHSVKTPTQIPSFLVEVSDGEETFTIKTLHRPEIGSKMAVMVDTKGQVQLLPKETLPSINTPVEDGLKVSLPKQLNLQEINQLIKQLDTLSQSSQLGSEKLQQTLTKLISSIPNLTTLVTHPESLKQTFQQSGLFLESNLAKETPSIEKDIKLNFLKLQAAISEMSSTKLPSQFDLVENAIERITTNQLKHLVETVRTESQLFPLHMELPIKHGNSSSYVQFEIDKDASEIENHDQEKRRWLVKLKFDFPETGKIEARLSIKDNKADLIFVAENKHTELKIRSQLSQVKANLKTKDIEVERIDCFCAPLDSEPKQIITKRLIDVRT